MSEQVDFSSENQTQTMTMTQTDFQTSWSAASEHQSIESQFKQQQQHEEEEEEEPAVPIGNERAKRLELWWSIPQLEGIAPSARGGHSAVLVKTRLIVFGGHYFGVHGQFVYLNDVHQLDLETSTWSELRCRGEPPKGRYNHCALLVHDDRMFVFGGKGESGQVFRDMFYLDLVHLRWYEVKWTTESPIGRFGFGACVVQSQLYIHGGWDGRKSMKDLWVFETDNFTWQKPHATGNKPSARHDHCLEAVENGERLVVFGGYSVLPESAAAAAAAAAAQTAGARSLKHPSGLPEYLHDVYVLDTETLEWSRPRVTGTYPIGTFGHRFCRIEPQLGFVIGGWSGTERGTICTGDKKVKDMRLQSGRVSRKKKEITDTLQRSTYVHVFDTSNNEWHQPRCHGCEVMNRYGHSCTLVGPHLFVFGGWDGNRALNQTVVAEISE